ncbi:hypothetical protein [Hyphomicrobium sp. ghe19]|uniref:hypothetical protein n=1 Tax=Hyphomicrobium sp. ghe19 TaxID=2682968 RepID=UPI0013673737|nr:hypothetical protein HYPP_03825 [Hyphomicrobium sp. ghe19]
MSGLSNHVRAVDEVDAGDIDPRNYFLEMFRDHLEAVKRFGLEAQARAIFAGVFPPASKPAEPDAIDPDEPVDMLENRLLIDACKRGANFKWPDNLHNARKRIQAGAERELARQLKERRPAQ